MSDQTERAAAHLAQFAYTATRAGTVFISWNGKTVTTLKGSAAQRFLAQVAELDEDGARLLMAKLTGNFKRGNERVSSSFEF